MRKAYCGKNQMKIGFLIRTALKSIMCSKNITKVIVKTCSHPVFKTRDFISNRLNSLLSTAALFLARSFQSLPAC